MALASLLENPTIFWFSQKLNPFTVSLYEAFAKRNVPAGAEHYILDIGCGLGVHRKLFSKCRYTGIDINPEYISFARRMFGEAFFVMEAGRLQFEDASFTQAISIAMCHHLDDTTIQSMIREALRVLKPEGALHVIDPVLPVSSPAILKTFVFRSDRGRFQRTLGQMGELIGSVAHIAKVDVKRGLLHDVCYFKITR